MNTYLIPTTAFYCYEPYDHIYLVHANSAEEAYKKATMDLSGTHIVLKQPGYEFYPIEINIHNCAEYPFPALKKYDILNICFKDTEGAEYMSYFNVNWNNYTEPLSKKAAQEEWSNKTYPNKGILANYLTMTHKKLQYEKGIKIKDNYAIFNTGLYTDDYEEIYAYQKNNNDVKFLTAYELNKIGIHELPIRANYFDKPELLIFDPKCRIDVQYNHILSENKNIERIPEEIQNAKNLLAIVIGSIEIMKSKISMNYKLAIPQYYNNQIQLLLPLYLLGNETPDVALAVTKIGDHYQGHTCLTLDMAYNNARLIAKPESNWLSNS